MSRLADTLRSCMKGDRVRVTRELLEALAEDGRCSECAHERNARAWADERDDMRRQRDEARAVVAARWALAREVEELLGIAAGPAGDDRLREGVEAVRRLRSERDEARAALAALRDAASAVTLAGVTLAEIVHAEEWDALDTALAYTAAAAEAYTRRVRAEALREAAGGVAAAWRSGEERIPERWLRARADEIEGGR